MSLNRLKSPGIQKNTVERASYFLKNDRSYQRVGNDFLTNSIEIKKTIVGTSATRINTPESSSNFVIFHQSEDAFFYLGDVDVSINDIKVDAFDKILFESMESNNDNEIYGITASGSITVFAVGVKKE